MIYKMTRNSFAHLPGQSLVLALFAAAAMLLASCGSSHTAYTAPTVLNPAPGVTLQHIQVTPATPVILLSQSRQLYATGVYSDGSTADISSSVTWSASPASGGSTNFVTVNSAGMATGAAIGQSSITATVGPVVGLLALNVASDGFSSSTMAILNAPYKTTEIDVGYMPQQTQIAGAYAVQEVNLDADQFSSVLPPAVALKASIPMPAGFEPNLAVASQTDNLVAVISYSSPAIQIIDASNNPLDVANNSIITAYTAPVTQSTTLNGISCMICAAVVNPLNNQLILSTAQGFYSMGMTSGTFTAIPFSPAPAATANFAIFPTALPDPLIVSAVPASGQVQLLDLSTHAVTTLAGFSPAPSSVSIDLNTQFGSVADASTGDQTLVDFTNPQSPAPQLLAGLGLCQGATFLNMNAQLVNYTGGNHVLVSSNTGGNCLGVESWPIPGDALLPSNINYGYAAIPATPDNNPFVNGSDPNQFAAFNSVYDKKTYGVLVDANQQWIAKINLGTAESCGNISSGGPILPAGADVTDLLLNSCSPDPFIFLPTPSTTFTLSLSNISFGTVNVGTSSPQIPVTLANIGADLLLPQISLQGTNASDFSLQNNCTVSLAALSSCTIDVMFTPTTTSPLSAEISVAVQGLPTQTVPLCGNTSTSCSGGSRAGSRK